MFVYNSYGSSTIYSIWSKGSASLSNNECSYFLNKRFGKTSSPSCCGCCTCCPIPIHRVPISPSSLYGLRQSTLLQWSASRWLILGGGDLYYCRFPVLGLHRVCYEVPCSVKQRSPCNRSERRRSEKCCCMISEDNSGIHNPDGFDSEDDAEAILSFLGEEVEEKYHGGRQRRKTSYKRVEVEKRGSCGVGGRNVSSSKKVQLEKSGTNNGREKSSSSFKRVTVDKKGGFGGECNSGGRKNGDLTFQESNSNNLVEPVMTESREENYNRNNDTVIHSRSTNHRGRKGGSSCSSYYSFSLSGNYENDTEVQGDHGVVLEELPSGYAKGQGRNEGGRVKGQVSKEFQRYGDNLLGNAAVCGGVELDRGKKSERKAYQVSLGETQSMRESSQINSSASRTHGSGYEKASSSQKKFAYGEDSSGLAVNFDEEAEEQYVHAGNQGDGSFGSRRQYQKFTETPEISFTDFERASWTEKRLIGRRKNVEIDANLVQEANAQHQHTVSFVSEDNILRQRAKSQKVDKVLEVRGNDMSMTSDQQRRSNTEVIGEEKTSLIKGTSDQETKLLLRQTEKRASGQIDSRQTFQQSSDVSVIRDITADKNSISSSETRLKDREQKLILNTTSYPESKVLQSQIDKKSPQRVHRNGSRTDMSIVHATDERFSAKRFDKRISNEESKKVLEAKPVTEIRKERKQRDGLILKIEFPEEESRDEESSSQASLRVSEARLQVIDVAEKSKRSSQEILRPPPSQLVARGPSYVEVTSGIATREISSQRSESESSALYMQSVDGTLLYESNSASGSGESYGEPLYVITPDDALGSTNRLEKSSTQIVGEFVEKVRSEVSTSEIRKEDKISQINLVLDGDKYGERSSSHYGSDIQMKDNDKRCSSQGTGTKGPAVEMWHVTDQSVEQTPKVEEPKGGLDTGNAIVKRSGKSLWNIIGDIVRLRWGSHSESPKSAERSGDRTSPNESVSNETWFSGHEPEETTGNNTETGRSIPPDTTPLERLQIGKTSIQSQEVSVKTKLDDKTIYYEADRSSSPYMKEGASSSGGNLFASEKEKLGRNEDRKEIEGVSAGVVIAQSSILLPAGSISNSPIVEEFSRTRKTNVSGTTSMEQSGRPGSVDLPEVSRHEAKDGELKQRKFQRTKQVGRDRFDEWEEAYILETEQRKNDEMFMREALAEAMKAADTWEVPVGAVLVQHGKIIARGYNLVEELRDSTAHAEMICIREGSNLLKTWRLADTTLYVTLEPCAMCAGAILQARIDTLVWGAPNKLLGADGSWIRLFPNGEEGNGSEQADKPVAPVHPFHPNMRIRRGVLASECADVMQQFFQLRRKTKIKKVDPPSGPSSAHHQHHPSKILTKMHDIFHIMFCL